MMTKLPENFELDRYGLHVRLVREEDAEFIVKLRTQQYNRQYLHSDRLTIDKQLDWLKSYKKREFLGKDYYFVFLYNNIKVGVVRLYNVNDEDFHCGSWVFDDNIPSFCALAGAIIAREIAFENLGKTVELNNADGIDSRNVNVQHFMKILGIELTDERYEGSIKYLVGVLRKEDFVKNKKKIIRFFPKEYQS